jgi:hypothetical protein
VIFIRWKGEKALSSLSAATRIFSIGRVDRYADGPGRDMSLAKARIRYRSDPGSATRQPSSCASFAAAAM